MSDIQDSILLISWVMLTFGWVLHLMFLMKSIQLKRQRTTTVKWFIKNRPYKFVIMLLTPAPLGLIQYVIADPSTFDITTLEGRLLLGGYLASMLLTGAGSNHIIDKVGMTNTIGVIEDDGDDYATKIGSVKEYLESEKKNDQ